MSHELLPEALQPFYRAVDTLDVGGYGRAFVADASVAFGNLAPVVGREAIVANFAGMAETMLVGIRHDFATVWRSDASVALESTVTYTLKDASVISIPCVTTLLLDADWLIREMRMYLDPTPLFGAAQGAAVA